MRYSGPLGKSVQGNQVRAWSLQGVARRLVGQLIAKLNSAPFSGTGYLRGQQTLSGGASVHATVNMVGGHPVVRTWIDVPEVADAEVQLVDNLGAYVFLGLVWIPEGLMVTPKTEAAPYGYGFPKRDAETGARINAPWGTRIEDADDECLNQCMFNRFANNRYLDHPDYITGLEGVFTRLPANPRLRASVADPVPADGQRFYRHWNFCYEPVLPTEYSRAFWDENYYDYVDRPGLNIVTAPYEPFIPFRATGKPGDEDREPLIRQFTLDASVSLIDEPVDTRWYCHWPEECLYENRTYESVFQEVNRLRRAVGEAPLTRPLRGIPSGAWSTVNEMQRARVQYHENEGLYRPGYGTVMQRHLARGLIASGGVGENLQTTRIDDLNSTMAGVRINRAWEHSPPHYANIIDPQWSSPKGGTALDIGGGQATQIEESGPPIPVVYDPAVSGRSYAQWFEQYAKYATWLHAGRVYNHTPWGAVSIGATDNCLFPYTVNNGRAQIYFRGRVFLFGPALNSASVVLVGVSLFTGPAGLPWFRALSVNNGELPGLMAHVCPLSAVDSAFEWREEASVLFTDLVSASFGAVTSTAAFTSNGESAVLMLAAPDDTRVGELWFPADPASPEPSRIVFTTHRVAYHSTEGFSAERIVTPNVTFDWAVHYDEGNSLYYCDWYSQRCHGSFEALSFFDLNDERKALTYHVDLDCVQHRVNTPSIFRMWTSLEFISGKSYPIYAYDLVNGTAVGPCFTTVFLYIDPIHEDVVYARIPLRRDGAKIYASVELYYNDQHLKSYAEALVSVHYPTQDGRISSGWETMDGYNLLDNLIDLYFLNNTDKYSRMYPWPIAVSTVGWEAIICSLEPTIRINNLRPFKGAHPVSLYSRYGSDVSCYSVGDPKRFVYGLELSIPRAGYSGVFDVNSDQVLCHFARYDGRVALEVWFGQLFGITADDDENGDSIIWANFDIEQEVGLGELKSLMPLGVI